MILISRYAQRLISIMSEFMKELKRWKIIPVVEYGRVVLYNRDKRAREHYSSVLLANPEFEVKLILELSETDKYVRELIEERAAIRESDGLPGDLESAVKCNICP